MTTLLLIRHGESEANRTRIFSGQIDSDLQDKGLEQAKLTAKYIAENYNVDKIYSSDLRRAYKTAECLAEIVNLDIITEPNLREIDGGEWEGVKYDEVLRVYPEEFNTWLYDIGRAGCVGGESVRQLGDRIMKILTQIAEENDGKTVAIATHATPIRVAQCLIENGVLDKMEDIPWVSNASVTVFEYNDNFWKINAVSIDEHLSELKTVLPSKI